MKNPLIHQAIVEPTQKAYSLNGDAEASPSMLPGSPNGGRRFGVAACRAAKPRRLFQPALMIMVAMATLCLVAPPSIQAEGEHWVPLYNKLVSYINDRVEASFRTPLNTNSQLNPLTNATSVTQTHMHYLRSKVINLAKDQYVLPDPAGYIGYIEIPMLYKVADAGVDEWGNEILRSPTVFDLAGLPNENAFTLIPSRYNNGNPVYANTFPETAPILYEHFYEIYLVARQLKWAVTWPEDVQVRYKYVSSGNIYTPDFSQGDVIAEYNQETWEYDENGFVGLCSVIGYSLGVGYGVYTNSAGDTYHSVSQEGCDFIPSIENIFTEYAHKADFYLKAVEGIFGEFLDFENIGLNEGVYSFSLHFPLSSSDSRSSASYVGFGSAPSASYFTFGDGGASLESYHYLGNSIDESYGTWILQWDHAGGLPLWEQIEPTDLTWDKLVPPKDPTTDGLVSVCASCASKVCTIDGKANEYPDGFPKLDIDLGTSSTITGPVIRAYFAQGATKNVSYRFGHGQSGGWGASVL